MTRQLSLTFGNRHGGRRKGAGRKPKGAQAGVKHRPRPKFVRRTPVLVTQRIAADCPSLRRAEELAIFRQLVIGLADETFAIVHWSLQSSHVHALVEARDSVVLARKLGGFFAQLAKRLNRHWKRTGKVFPDRFEARVLASPSVVRTALIYTLGNARKHGSWGGRAGRTRTRRGASGAGGRTSMPNQPGCPSRRRGSCAWAGGSSGRCRRSRGRRSSRIRGLRPNASGG